MADRLRLVVMGDSFVGKSSIVKRFLFNTFTPKYTQTVEDLYSRDYELAGTALNVDILDTAGDAQFPAMRRLSISSAHAFLLVYSVTDPTSFGAIKHRVEEIKEQRSDFQDIPIVIVGNKIDLIREIEISEVQEWVDNNMLKQRTEVIETSSLENVNIQQSFKFFLRLSKINFGPNCGYKDDTQVGLRRNFSAYGRLKSPMRNPKPPNSQELHTSVPLNNPKETNGGSGNASPVQKKIFGFPISPFGSPASTGSSSSFRKHLDVGEERFIPGRNSKRSRSLVRRSSKKVKQQINNVHNPEECAIS